MAVRSRQARRDQLTRIAFALCTLFFGIAALLSMVAPAGIDLGQELLMLDPATLGWLQRHVTPGLWRQVLGPFLVRPVWLIPAMLGAIAGAVAWSVRMAGRSR